MKTKKHLFKAVKLLTITLMSLGVFTHAKATQDNIFELDRNQVENIVKRSYQYVAMYNVNNKTAETDESSAMGTGGWNQLSLNTSLFDATIKNIVRPNNDTLYQIAMLDLRDQPMILDIPAIDSSYVSLQTSAYDHYVNVPLSSVKGDYTKAETVLFYTERTKGYQAGEQIPGIDRYLEMSGDFVIAFHRIMPHANEPEKFKEITEKIDSLKLLSLSEYQTGKVIAASPIIFPKVGTTDTDVFRDNLLEVMQFIFNHTTFDINNEMDQELLAAYKPLGIVPGKEWNPLTHNKIDHDLFHEVALDVQKDVYRMLNDPTTPSQLTFLFKPKGEIGLLTQTIQSVLGPIGLPVAEAMYPPVQTVDGEPMNALNDYVVRMKKDDMPPANAFWSITLYDSHNGFFIPNAHNKYSVGENAGYKLNSDGGIDIYIAAEKPAGVPTENWLPINRNDEGIDLILRIYATNFEKLQNWKAPSVTLLE
ncbi:DUF1214 domain-containing protein [Vibrio sp. 10N.261.46.E12]|uniref:DUF1214 domain-containing protein n=1 Tax=unclassified Vibrio TaxID=2614977 RepID=UPI000976E33B|nr:MULTISPECIES: DUF1214 domain-containing protein [unclassified Vibrio]OMO35066.1 hypothetical protein BH584_10665 [Vibrio sp. 10N.261.45.E1]PMJ36241.1 hypothetical protein BCU27_23305 [Vibrio sp. 10N.286.45.B6]PML96130.1 hypothetical protein BCT66_22260 [Vibrio sp. 10N.261.49.E11]PMM68417.1 hypothetical protein BCT48_11670 [Vibrio sp. 10N.261.46.F12]PMM80283.1 hypothetical protein BCT46_18340 [Vibrio sp. 10N.261.46.E8]